MRIVLILIITCFISCGHKTNEKECTINFKTSQNEIYSEGVVSHLECSGDILKVSISNFRSDTISFLTPHLFFLRRKKKDYKEDTTVVVKPYMPNIATDKVITYSIFEGKKEIISIDSSKNRDAEQQEFKLAPKGKFTEEYLLNCEESDSGEYKIFFFENNRFDNSKYEKIKYPENAYIEIRNKHKQW
jgi:hypothetical protein